MNRIQVATMAWVVVALTCHGEETLVTAGLSLTGNVERVELTNTNATPRLVAEKTLRKWLANPPSILQREADGSYTLGGNETEDEAWSLTLRSRDLLKPMAAKHPALPETEVTLKIDPERNTYDAAQFGIGSRTHNLWLTVEQNDDDSWTGGLQLRRDF